METNAHACERLLTALEELVAQETGCLQARDFETVLALQKRAAPLVQHLATNGPSVADAAFRARIAAVLAKREESTAWLAREIAAAKQQLDSVDAGSRRASRMLPAYARSTGPTAATRRLAAIG